MRIGSVETISTAESPMQLDENALENQISDPNIGVEYSSDRKDSEPETLYERSIEFIANLFLIFDGQSDSYVGVAVFVLTTANIFFGLAVYSLSTMSNYRTAPSTCSYPACDNDPNICPGVIICEPVAKPFMIKSIQGSLYIFLIEYAIRVLTCWAVSSRVANVEYHYLRRVLQNIRTWICNFTRIRSFDDEDSVANSLRSEVPLPMPVYHPFLQVIYFVAHWRNILDLFSFLPFFYTNESDIDAQHSYVFFLRIFRLVRLWAKINTGYFSENDILYNTLVDSATALFFILIFSGFLTMFWGTIIYFCEQGHFAVTEEYPIGVYLRTSGIPGTPSVPSTFTSIPASMYWVVTTITTVGYGDLVPTSVAGRLIANAVMFCGVAAFALPVSVLTSNFQSNWDKHLKHVEAKKKRRKKRAQESRKAGLHDRKIFYSETKRHCYYYKRFGVKKFTTRLTVYDKIEERFEEDVETETSSNARETPKSTNGDQSYNLSYSERTPFNQRSPLDGVSSSGTNQSISMSSPQLPQTQPSAIDNSPVIIPKDLYKKLYDAYTEKLNNRDK